MRKIVFSAICTILLSSFFVSSAVAGTFMIGAKGWYAEWDSAFDKAVADLLAESGYTSTVKPGKGFLAGPVIAYQNGNWSFSGAFMLLSSFDNKTEFENLSASSETKMTRRDIDLALSYSLTDYFKVFAGYKYITSKYNVDFSNGNDFYDAKMISHIPTAGLAFAYQIINKLTAGIQFGLLYVISDYKLTPSGSEEEKVDVDNGYGINIEPNLSYFLLDCVMLQFGVRYQIYNVKFTDLEGWSGSKNDKFLGVTLGAMYVF
jgi:hypothetical protein